jgi:AcrR family transcriptional regulator
VKKKVPTNVKTRFSSRSNETTLRRRRQIFDIAIHLFNEKGIADTTVREIADAAGLSMGGLYHFIKSKDEIINMLTENSMYFHESIKNVRKNLGDVSATEAFRACAKYWLTVSPSAMEQTIFFEREKLHLPIEMQDKISNIVRDLIIFFEDLLKEGIASGEFKIDNVTLVAFHVYFLRGLFGAKQWFLKGLISPEEYATHMTEAILKQIKIDKIQTS